MVSGDLAKARGGIERNGGRHRRHRVEHHFGEAVRCRIGERSVKESTTKAGSTHGGSGVHATDFTATVRHRPHGNAANGAAILAILAILGSEQYEAGAAVERGELHELPGEIIESSADTSCFGQRFGLAAVGTEQPFHRGEVVRGSSVGDRGHGVQRTVRRGWKRRNRRLFETTNTLDSAMDAPAISGLRRPEAANGSAATL
jgi:hypothetical protein